MRTTVTLLAASSLILAGCGGWGTSRLNPTNWFGSSTSAPVEQSVDANVNPLIPDTESRISLFGDRDTDTTAESPLVETVTELNIERTPSGAIIRATGVAFRQGAYGAFLRPIEPSEDSDSSVLAFDFTVIYPENGTPVGSEQSRSIQVARTISLQDLNGVSTVRIVANQNTRESRRR
ncbi:MAG: hypothetical protein ACU0BB_02165 [Paracoccaceae bacterium]|jgi:hypothetical protein